MSTAPISRPLRGVDRQRCPRATRKTFLKQCCALAELASPPWSTVSARHPSGSGNSRDSGRATPPNQPAAAQPPRTSTPPPTQNTTQKPRVDSPADRPSTSTTTSSKPPRPTPQAPTPKPPAPPSPRTGLTHNPPAGQPPSGGPARQRPPQQSLPPPHAPPPPAPDHSTGGFALVSTTAELGVMLDQLVAAGYMVPEAAAAAGGGGRGAGRGGSKGDDVAGSARGGRGGGVAAASIGSARALAVDCEGVQLGRSEGQLCLLQLSARCGGGGGGGRGGRGGSGGGGGRGLLPIWLVDVGALGRGAFKHTAPLDGRTSLKGLLEEPTLTKYLYDVRNDAAALSAEFNVRLRGVVDLQLADVAVRQAEGGLRAGGWVEGLVSALSRRLAGDGRASAPPGLAADLAAATRISQAYHESNNTEVWARRPLTHELCAYAASDVRYLHALADALAPWLPRELADKVIQESHRRTLVRESNSDKDSRAAAPVMVTPAGRQRAGPQGAAPATASTSTSSALAAAGTAAVGSPAARGTPGAAGAADRLGLRGGGGGGGGAAATPAARYMGLMEWLTAALLLQYDRTAGPAATAQGPAGGPGTAAADMGVVVSGPEEPHKHPVAPSSEPAVSSGNTPPSRVGEPASASLQVDTGSATDASGLATAERDVGGGGSLVAATTAAARPAARSYLTPPLQPPPRLPLESSFAAAVAVPPAAAPPARSPALAAPALLAPRAPSLPSHPSPRSPFTWVVPTMETMTWAVQVTLQAPERPLGHDTAVEDRPEVTQRRGQDQRRARWLREHPQALFRTVAGTASTAAGASEAAAVPPTMQPGGSKEDGGGSAVAAYMGTAAEVGSRREAAAAEAAAEAEMAAAMAEGAEDRRQARLAMEWLRRCQRALEGRLPGAGPAVRRDPGLRWLLPPP